MLRAKNWTLALVFLASWALASCEQEESLDQDVVKAPLQGTEDTTVDATPCPCGEGCKCGQAGEGCKCGQAGEGCKCGQAGARL